jgi:hypothetical protein
MNTIRTLIKLFTILILSGLNLRVLAQNMKDERSLESAMLPETASSKATVYPVLIDTSFSLVPRKEYKTSFDNLNFGPEKHTSGIYTFRGNNQRNSPVLGTLSGRPVMITEDWFFKTDEDTVNGIYGTWRGGAGWTGQPLYVEWTAAEVKELTGVSAEFKIRDQGLNEIIQVSLCGKVYFIEAETGQQTRKPLEINNPIKGTPSIDGINRKFLLVGQGIKNRGLFAFRIFDLRKNILVHLQPMPSPFAPKGWGACDASPLIDPESGIFIWPTESGVIYRGMLDDQHHPPYEQYKYSIAEHPRQGIESSPSAYGNLGYFNDNAGNVLCIDLLNMKPRWHFFNNDDSDASPVLEVENDIPYIYVGNEVDQQGSSGKAYLRKLNGLTGKTVWEYERTCYSVTIPRTNNGGMLTTPSVGRNKTAGFIWTIFSRVDTLSRGSFVCLNTADGKIKYEIPLGSYSWASPIALYDAEGNAYVYFTDVGGSMYLINGETGEIIFRNNTGEIFESSPVAIGNRIIQPARGDKIFSFIIH